MKHCQIIILLTNMHVGLIRKSNATNKHNSTTPMHPENDSNHSARLPLIGQEVLSVWVCGFSSDFKQTFKLFAFFNCDPFTPPLIRNNVRYKYMYLISLHPQPDEAKHQITLHHQE